MFLFSLQLGLESLHNSHPIQQIKNKPMSSFFKSKKSANPFKFFTRTGTLFVALSAIFILFSSFFLPLPTADRKSALPFASSIVPTVGATSVYANLAGGNLSLNITPATTNLITTNDDWSGVASVEGYFRQKFDGDARR